MVAHFTSLVLLVPLDISLLLSVTRHYRCSSPIRLSYKYKAEGRTRTHNTDTFLSYGLLFLISQSQTGSDHHRRQHQQ
ncbi:hypothetical protein BJY52DRAFT_1294216, partial [Lactarius psammicola]